MVCFPLAFTNGAILSVPVIMAEGNQGWLGLSDNTKSVISILPGFTS